MDLSTSYLGLQLANPILPGPSPLAGDLDTVRRLEDAGAPAIVLHSLFEEQIIADTLAHLGPGDLQPDLLRQMEARFPRQDLYSLQPPQYLDHLRRVKAAVAVPVIASLNGVTPGGWTKYARLLAEAGADAVELNLYYVATRTHEEADQVETRQAAIVAAVRDCVDIPIAVKLTPFYTALPNFAARLSTAGASGLVLFNRFYAPSIDVGRRARVAPSPLSSGSELSLRLFWLSILAGQVPLSLAASGGVHAADDAISAIMAGAQVVQMVSALLEHGPEHLRTTRNEMERRLEAAGWGSLAEARGSLSLAAGAHPLADERSAYIRLLHDPRYRRHAPG